MLRDQITEALKKVVLKKVTLEEAGMFLNDLEKRAGNKGQICNLLCDMYRALLLQDTHARTLLNIVAHANNPNFNSVLILGLEHPDESAGLAALEGMARYKDEAAKAALLLQLENSSPHIRMLAGEMIINKWGVEGVKIMITSGLCSPDPDVINAARSILAEYGVVAVPLVIDAMASMSMVSLRAAAKLLLELNESVDIADCIGKGHLKKILQVLQIVADKKQPDLVISVLELLNAFKNRLAGYEENIAVMMYFEHPTINLVAHKVLSRINTDRSRQLLSAVKIPLAGGGYIIDQPLPPKK